MEFSQRKTIKSAKVLEYYLLNVEFIELPLNLLKIPLIMWFAIIFLIILSSFTYSPKVENVEGVSFELAQLRKSAIDSVVYKLDIDLRPGQTSDVMIAFDLDKAKLGEELHIDFKSICDSVATLLVNGRCVGESRGIVREHIVVDQEYLADGYNEIFIEFIPGTEPMNINSEYLYTLLVPDRARELFPCFDQPDLKASYILRLVVDEQWECVSNSPVSQSYSMNDGYKVVEFLPTEPLSTYLFAFAAGKFQKSLHSSSGRQIIIYHRETSQQHISQLDSIAYQVFSALDWLEEYTSIDYPFAKYDLVIIPGFQFGGMEHTGATFYNASLMFLPENATLAQRLRRDMLIAHETAHMWFGDYVTMEWFSGVWIKEVFANYFAAQMIRPHYSGIDFKLQDLSFNVSAYQEDRTLGANPIQQELPNLRYAGLIYGNIIYQKSPVVMEMLSEKMGPEAFRSAIREYLATYAYSNADWDDLVEIFDRYYHSPGETIEEWSEYWIYGKGMPVVRFEDGQLEGLSESHQNIDVVSVGERSIPLMDGSFYGYVELDTATLDFILENLYDIAPQLSEEKWGSAELVRVSYLMVLYENWIRGNLSSSKFAESLRKWLFIEENQQVLPILLSYISEISAKEGLGSAICADFENDLYRYLNGGGSAKFRTQVLRTLVLIATNKSIVDYIYKVWNKNISVPGLALSENDYIDLSLELAIRRPSEYDAIISEQLSRISNPDKIREYLFVSPAASPSANARDSVFNSFYDLQNRRTEPWVLRSLLLLHHPYWGDYSVKYIYPSLELIEELQRTGDIFFPKSWCKNTLYHHHSLAAKKSVLRFLEDTPELLPLLENKILQSAYHLGIR